MLRLDFAVDDLCPVFEGLRGEGVTVGGETIGRWNGVAAIDDARAFALVASAA